MIVPENIMTDVIKAIKPINYNGRDLLPEFHYGNKDELNRFLDKFKDQVYPLIWMLPAREDHKIAGVEMNPTFILAVNFNQSESDLLNNDRIEANFKGILIPLAERLMDRILKNRNASFDNKDFEVMKYPNYHETKQADQPDALIHLWDALTLSLNMSFKNNC